MRAKVDCVAVTDHNTGGWIDRLKDELSQLEQENHREFRRICLFPGIEISVNGGFHLLAIFDTDKTRSDIDELIGAIEYDGSKGDSDGVTRKSAVEVVEVVLDRDGIPILAHADRPKGLLRPKCEGSRETYVDANTVSQVLDTPGILGMEIVDANWQKPEIYAQRKLGWAEILGSDSHHPGPPSVIQFPGSHYTWVKMARPTLEGLRLALLDGEGFSTRRSDEAGSFDPFVVPGICIDSIAISEARYMGRGGRPAKLRFNPWLNAIVGGRGTGKSTVLHALRLVARRETDLLRLPEHSTCRQTFERFNKVPSDRTQDGGLTASTAISWVLSRNGVRHRINWSEHESGFAVEEYDTGEWRRSEIQSVSDDRFPLRILSQAQIGELAGDDPSALLQEVDRSARVGLVRGRLDEAVAAFGASRAGMREIDSRLEGSEDAIAIEFQDVERKLAHFEDAAHSKILSKFRQQERQRRELNRRFESVEAIAERIEALAEVFHLESLPDGLFDDSLEEDRQAVKILDSLRSALEDAAEDARSLSRRIRQIAKSGRRELESGTWGASARKSDEAYRDFVKSLEAEGVSDPNEYDELVKVRQRLEVRLRDLQSLKTDRERIVKECERRFLDLSAARRDIARARNEFLSDALSQNEFVRIDIRPYGDDPRAIERSLRDALNVPDERFSEDILVIGDASPSRGVVADLVSNLPDDPELRCTTAENRIEILKTRFEKACNGQGDFGGHFNNYLARQFDRRPGFLDGLLQWFPEDGLSVKYSRTGDGTEFLPISQASTGQRSAAMLAFLLAHGDEPLVLDQPEDDLDNHLIYDLVVRQIRENKLRRQIIVVTHNPNIVVNGDAEMLHALSFERGQCIVGQAGSLQEQVIRDEVCRVMEGGREAFSRRYRRLGSEFSYNR